MIRILGIAWLGAVLACPAHGEQRLRAVTDDQGVTIFEGHAPVLRYQRTVKSLGGKWPRANYVHPLFDLDGDVITEDFPADHRHHRGLFWAWHQVIVGDKKLGDSWKCERFVWDVQSVETFSERAAHSITATVLWKSPDHVGDDGEAIPVVRERTKVTVHRRTQNLRSVDFQISLLALVDDVKIGGSEDAKGYGGFSPRIILNDRQRFTSAVGEVKPVKTAVEAGSWINVTDGTRGIAILSGRKNPQPNNRWILRAKRSMQNAVFPGREPVALSKTDPLVLRYRLAIHRGDLTTEEIAKLQSSFDR